MAMQNTASIKAFTKHRGSYYDFKASFNKPGITIDDEKMPKNDQIFQGLQTTKAHGESCNMLRAQTPLMGEDELFSSIRHMIPKLPLTK